MTRRGLVLAAAVILVTNAFVLLGVARNRAGRSLQTIQLTERELPMNYRGKEDSGVALRIQWNQYSFAMFDQYSWLDRAKLESLGFDCDAALGNDRPRPSAG
jgi:hypothetical protein